MIEKSKIMEALVAFIEDYCEMYGVKHAICYLMECSFTKEDLLELDFEEEDIDECLEDPDAAIDAENSYVEDDDWDEEDEEDED